MATHGKTHGSISVVRSCHMRPDPHQMVVDQQKQVFVPKTILLCSLRTTLPLAAVHPLCYARPAYSILLSTVTLTSSYACVHTGTPAQTRPIVRVPFLFLFPLSNVDARPSHSDTMLAFSHHRMALTCQVGDRTDTRRKATAFLPARLKWCQPLTVITREMERCWTRIVWT